MNRRAFLQSVIAVPLVAVGMPRAQTPMLGRDAYPNLRAALWTIRPGAEASTYDFSLTPEVRRAWADAIAQQIDDEALRRGNGVVDAEIAEA